MTPSDAATTRQSLPGPGLSWIPLEQLEQRLLRGDMGPDDLANARRLIDTLATHASAAGWQELSTLAAATSALFEGWAQGRLKATSVMQDTLLQATEMMRGQLCAPSGARTPGAELEGLLFAMQAMARSPSTPQAPASGAGYAPWPEGRGTAAWPDVDALLARVGECFDAQTALALAWARCAAPDRTAVDMAMAQIDARMDALAAAARKIEAGAPMPLPSSPHLVQVLVLRAGSAWCAVPSAAVLDCGPITDAGPQPVMPPESSPGGPGGEDAPLDLAGWLGTHGPDGTEGPRAGRQLLRLAAGGHHRSCVADEVMFQRTVVELPLVTHFRALPGISGAVVLGDGRVALVLDPATLPRGAAPDAAGVAPATV